MGHVHDQQDAQPGAVVYQFQGLVQGRPEVDGTVVPVPTSGLLLDPLQNLAGQQPAPFGQEARIAPAQRGLLEQRRRAAVDAGRRRGSP